MSANKQFAAKMANTFISATFGNIVADAVMAGIKGTGKPFDWSEEIFGSMQVGTAFIAYPCAVEFLSKHCKFVQKAQENNENYKVYIAGGLGAAAITTAVNIPLQKIKEAVNSKKNPDFTVKEFAVRYVNSVPGAIGFAATLNTLGPQLPTFKNSLLEYGKGIFLVTCANIGASLSGFPLRKIQSNARLIDAVLDPIYGIPSTTICNDSVSHFSKVLGFISE